MIEHDYEPVPGLPARLPAGETILWQGAPNWQTLTRRAMRVRQVAFYFAILGVWGAVGRLSDGASVADVAMSSLQLGGLAVGALALLTLFGWLSARSAVYTITNKRVVMRFGIALPMTIQIPFSKIDAASLNLWSDGTGDVALSLQANQRIAYLVTWPHVRPWKFTRSQPALRAIPDAAAVAQILGRALAASASQPAHPVKMPVPAEVGHGSHVPAAA